MRIKHVHKEDIPLLSIILLLLLPNLFSADGLSVHPEILWPCACTWEYKPEASHVSQYLHTHIHAHMHTYMHTYTHTYTHIQTHLYTYMQTQVILLCSGITYEREAILRWLQKHRKTDPVTNKPVCTHIYMHRKTDPVTNKPVCTHIYTHTYMHTYKQSNRSIRT
jgi:hypothetical protein